MNTRTHVGYIERETVFFRYETCRVVDHGYRVINVYKLKGGL